MMFRTKGANNLVLFLILLFSFVKGNDSNEDQKDIEFALCFFHKDTVDEKQTGCVKNFTEIITIGTCRFPYLKPPCGATPMRYISLILGHFKACDNCKGSIGCTECRNHIECGDTRALSAHILGKRHTKQRTKLKP